MLQERKNKCFLSFFFFVYDLKSTNSQVASKNWHRLASSAGAYDLQQFLWCCFELYEREEGTRVILSFTI